MRKKFKFEFRIKGSVFFMPKQKNHCSKCNFELKIVNRRSTVVYNCLEYKDLQETRRYRIQGDNLTSNKNGLQMQKLWIKK